MKLNSILLEGVVADVKATKRRVWLIIDSDGVIVKTYADKSLKKRVKDKVSKGCDVMVLGQLVKGMKVRLNHVEYRNGDEYEVETL